ncbi:isopentenyl-diphosphate Delta-isomerase [Candidatus Aenigmatarchaeota archaeon]
MEKVILVDENDNAIGEAEKMKAHEDGALHRAFSIFVFNSQGKLLLQQRAKHKYHCGGLWTNTTCSHPRSGEETKNAAHRRLKEEMGFDTDLEEVFSFIYKVKFDNGLHEHEFDHVFVGNWDGDPKINKEEVEDFKWINPEELKEDVMVNPDKYTYWFIEALDKIIEHIKK